jgi:hypothetical protein
LRFLDVPIGMFSPSIWDANVGFININNTNTTKTLTTTMTEKATSTKSLNKNLL